MSDVPPPLMEALPRPQASADMTSESEEIRVLLQKRLGLFAQAVLLIDLLYYPLFQLSLYFDAEQVARSTTERPCTFIPFIPELLGELVVFGGFWLLCRIGQRSLRTLQRMDVVGTLLSSTVFSMWPYVHPYPLLGSYEGLLSLVVVLNLRATLVPSSMLRTLMLNAISGMIGVLAMYFAAVQRGITSPPPLTLLVLGLNWYTVAVFFSTFTSAVIYGLHKQVRDARRLGQYVLLEHLGSGAMGSVFLARHTLLRRHTAIKLLRNATTSSSSERFEREVQLTSLLNHPNIISIFDYGRTTDGIFYYAMEYLDGLDLEQFLEVEGPLPPERVIHILLQVCSALEMAHKNGLIHRDIKPANIFLCREHGLPDTVKVLDFGLVKELHASEVHLTNDGAIVGTPLYLSPEGITTPGRMDGRSDLYSLGAVGYWLLTGRPVFEGRNTVETCASHLHAMPVHPAERLGRALPDDLCQVLLDCLQKRPEERPARARALRRQLETCADAGQWTDEQARQWWEQHAQRIAQVRTHRRQPVESGAVVTDLMARGA